MMDQMLEHAVLGALYLERSIDVSHILATVRGGVATLTGDVETPAQKLTAKRKVQDVLGICEVIDDLEVCPSEKSRRRFERVAGDVLNALFWDLAVPPYRVSARCDRGWVILSGEVDQPYQKSRAEADVRSIRGVVGVTNQITVALNGKSDPAHCYEAIAPMSAELH